MKAFLLNTDVQDVDHVMIVDVPLQQKEYQLEKKLRIR